MPRLRISTPIGKRLATFFVLLLTTSLLASSPAAATTGCYKPTTFTADRNKHSGSTRSFGGTDLELRITNTNTSALTLEIQPVRKDGWRDRNYVKKYCNGPCTLKWKGSVPGKYYFKYKVTNSWARDYDDLKGTIVMCSSW